MKVMFKGKDGGPESKVTGYWLFESKSIGSIVLLRFDKGSREAFHTHAFNAVSWVLSGILYEELINTRFNEDGYLTPSLTPIYTERARFHKVEGIAERTWVLSFRGPWFNKWAEFIPSLGKYIVLTHGRKQVD